MPKIMGSLADVSTEYVLIEPDDYEMRVKEIETEVKKSTEMDEPAEYPNGQITYIIISVIDQPDSEHNNKPVRDYINWYKKGPEGTTNEYARAQLKRYFEAILGKEEANREDLDTDELIGGRFQAAVYIDNWESKKTGKTGQNNKLKNILPLE